MSPERAKESKAIRELRREAKLRKRLGSNLTHTELLNAIANENGYTRWERLLEYYKTNETES